MQALQGGALQQANKNIFFSSRHSCPASHCPQAFRAATPQQRSPRSCTIVQAAASDVDDAIDVSGKDLDAVSDVKIGVARLRGVRGSPFKFRRVLDQIRGRTYEDSLKILEFLPYRAKEDVLTTLMSAAANAKNNEGALKKKLLVYECFADDAGMYKRFQPRAKGRPFPIHVKKSHLTIKVVET